MKVPRFALSPAVLIVALMAPATAHALESGWAETEGGRMRLVVDPSPRADGTLGAALDIDLAPGWKTYWIDPGSAGIPPNVDLTASQGVKLESIDYPPPVRVDDGYSIWSGYKHPVQFPMRIARTGSGDAKLNASVFIGICSDICVPFQANLSLDIPAAPVADSKAAREVASAFEALADAPAEDFAISSAEFADGQKEIEVSVKLPAFRPAGAEPSLFVAGPEGWAFAPPKSLEIADGVARFSVRIEGRPKSADPSAPLALNLVVTLGQRAIASRTEVR